MRKFLLLFFIFNLATGFTQTDSVKCHFSGYVIELYNQPISGATVILQSITEKDDTVYTNQDGKYCFSGFYDGMYNLYCYHKEYGSFSLKGILTKHAHGFELDTIKLSDLQIEHQKLYTKLVDKADEYFNSKDYAKAAELYQRAYNFKPTDAYVVDQINIITNALTAISCPEIQYPKIISKADELFQNKDFGNALKLYQRALMLKPNDPYPKEMIDSINEQTGN